MNENTLKEFALVKHVTIIVRVTFFTLWKISHLRPELCFVKARLLIHIHDPLAHWTVNAVYQSVNIASESRQLIHDVRGSRDREDQPSANAVQ